MESPRIWTPDDDEHDDLFAALMILAERPQCIHNLNGPCSVCGPSLTLEETIRWQQELIDLGVDGEDE